MLALATCAVNSSDSRYGNGDAQPQRIDGGKQPEESLWRPFTWTPITTFTFWLVAIGVVQAIVFAVQANTLNRTVETMEKIDTAQSAKMAESIAQAGRAAKAMEDVATSLAQNAATSIKIGDNQVLFAQKQMRAYISVNHIGVVSQNRETNCRTEVRMQLINTGHTPAHALHYRANALILSNPLSPDFDFHLPEESRTSRSTVGPGQSHTMSRAIPDLVSDTEVMNYVSGTESAVYMWGIIYFKDAFDLEHTVRFSQRIVWLLNGNTLGMNTWRHNDAD